MKNGRVQRDEIEKASNGICQDIRDKNAPEYLIQIEKIVQYLRKGWKNYNIRKELNISPYDFDVYIRDIKYKKIMTGEEIKAAREKKRQEDLQFIVDSVNAGLTITQIRELKPEFSYNEVTPMIRELIDEGRITQEKVDENVKNGIKRTKDKNIELSPDEQVQFILDKIKKGYAPIEIVKSDKTKSLTMHKVLYQKRQLIAKGIISAEEAEIAMQKRQEEALERKHKKIINRIKEYTELGYSLNEISEFITEYSYSYLVEIKRNYIKNNGWYTDEELKEFALQRKIREEEEAKRIYENLSPEEKKQIDEERKAEAERLEEERRKKREEILAKIQERKDETSRRHQEDANELKVQIKSGKSMEQAAQLMGLSLAYAYKIKRESMQNNTWLTEKELKAIEKRKKQRIEGAKKKREQQKLDEQNRKKEEEQLRIKQEVWKLREYIENGYTYKEISKMMNYSISHLQYLRKLAIADDIWFTKDAIEQFKLQREKREELENEKRQKEQQVKKDREQREAEKLIKEEEERIKAFNKERKRKIKGYAETYKVYRKAAKKEDKLELDGEENVSTEGRKKFIQILIKLHKLDADINEKDIEIVLNAIYIYPELADKETIKFLVLDANKRGGIKSAERMINELTNTLIHTKFYELLVEYKKWLKRQALFPQIQAMKEKGMSNSDIAEKLGISSAEVSIIFYEHSKRDSLGDEAK